MKNLFILILALLILCSYSCRKEQDSMNPVVEIWLPNDNQSFTIGDSIFVSGVASDETQLTSILITLTDNQLIVKDYFLSIKTVSNPQYFDLWYIPTNKQLPDGDYFIQVRASDGLNTKYKYKPIRLTRGAATLDKLLVLTSPSSNSFSLHTLDPVSLDYQQIVTYPHAYAGSGISLPSEQLYLLGQGFGECYAHELEDFKLDFILNQDGTPSLLYHESLLADNNRFYLGLTDGFIKGYNKLGIQLFAATLNQGRKPGVMYSHNQTYLIVAEEQSFGAGSWISAYFLHSGAKWSEYKLPDNLNITAILSLDSDRILLAGNLNGTGRVVEWNIKANSISTPLQFNSGKINDMLRLNSTQLLIAHEDEILIYNTTTQTAMPLLQHQGTKRLRYDSFSNTLFAATASGITAFNLQTKATIWQRTIPATLLDFHLNYRVESRE